jgi:hypothetical protein
VYNCYIIVISLPAEVERLSFRGTCSLLPCIVATRRCSVYTLVFYSKRSGGWRYLTSESAVGGLFEVYLK